MGIFYLLALMNVGVQELSNSYSSLWEVDKEEKFMKKMVYCHHNKFELTSCIYLAYGDINKNKNLDVWGEEKHEHTILKMWNKLEIYGI